MKRPRILLFFEYGTLNGGELSMLAILRALGRKEFEFVAATPSGMLTDRLKRFGIDVYPLILRNAQDQKLPVEQINSYLVELINKVSPDLVHSNSLAMGRMVGRIASQLPNPCTCHLRDIIKLNKKAVCDLNQNKGLIAVSKVTKKFHIEQGLLPDRVKVIYNGVDTKLFRPAPAKGMLKQQLGIGENAFLVANIGQICLRKGQVLLAQAAADLAGKFPQANYLFIGQRHSKKQESVEFEDKIRKIFQQAGIEGHLFCLGFREDVPAILNEIDLLVHTAHQEPLGRVLLEAASCGRAIIATKVGGTTEILTDDVSALLVRPDDIEALKAAIRRMLIDSELRIRLGCEARKQIEQKFSLTTAAARIRAFWKSFL